ncbi:MAG: SAP domain-containing protein, partial [Euryarchaeota archaeon]|nr:SAP domain-containing protein [Euryarchaeota archaeon]
MADDESFSFDSLSKLKVSELREICKNSELLISGNKAELIVRILENSSENQEDKELFLEEDIVEMDKTQSPVIETKGKTRSPRDIDDAIDRLISRVDGKESINIPPEEIPKNDVMEAEILEAEIFEDPAPSVDEMVGESLILDEEDSWGSTEFTEVKKEFIGTNEDIEKPSLTITLPSLDILKTYWPQISAVFVVILLVGTGVFYFLS